MSIDLGAKTNEGKFLFRGESEFVPRIGEEVQVGITSYIVENVKYHIRGIGKSQVILVLKRIEGQPEKGGHWIDRGYGVECSACGFTYDEHYLGMKVACPNCGTMMNIIEVQYD